MRCPRAIQDLANQSTNLLASRGLGTRWGGWLAGPVYQQELERDTFLGFQRYYFKRVISWINYHSNWTSSAISRSPCYKPGIKTVSVVTKGVLAKAERRLCLESFRLCYLLSCSSLQPCYVFGSNLFHGIVPACELRSKATNLSRTPEDVAISWSYCKAYLIWVESWIYLCLL